MFTPGLDDAVEGIPKPRLKISVARDTEPTKCYADVTSFAVTNASKSAHKPTLHTRYPTTLTPVRSRIDANLFSNAVTHYALMNSVKRMSLGGSPPVQLTQ